MTDYYPLIGRAVEGLAKNTGDARRALYERARAALVAQLRGVEPALSESEITKERLALEEAIRKVEAEAARKVLGEPRNSLRREPKLELRPATPLTRSSTADNTALNLSAAAMALRRERSAPPPEAPAAVDRSETGSSRPEATPHVDEPKQAEELPPAKQSARDRILGARAAAAGKAGAKAFRNLVSEADGLGAAAAKASHSARETRASYGPSSPARMPHGEDFPAPSSLDDGFEPGFHGDELQDDSAEEPHRDSLEPSYGEEDTHYPAPRPGRPQPPAPAANEEEEYRAPRPKRSYRGVAKIAVLLIVLGGVAAAATWQWSNIAGMYQFFTHLRTQPASPSPQGANQTTKFPGRVPQEQVPGQAATGAPNGEQPVAQVAQHAVLYEADPNDPQGKQFPGSVVWRTETVSPGPGLAPELVVRADIAIPERHMTVTWSLRRNTDKELPASHTIEIVFNLPADFPGGGIANVPGILMKDKEEVRGVPLAGLAVKVTNGFFLIGLNAAQQEMQRNLQLLKERAWFDVLLVYTNGGRAILTLEKGPPGERAFAEAFAAWAH